MAERHTGIVRVFMKGFGFINSPAVQEAHGQDVFLPKHEFGDLQVGDEVDFALVLKDDGKPRASDVKKTGNSVQVEVRAENAEATVDSEDSNERHSGFVQRYNPKSGFGFIHNPDIFTLYSKDVFLHKDNTNGVTFNEGDAVTFILGERNDGLPQALDVRSDGRPTRPAAPGQTVGSGIKVIGLAEPIGATIKPGKAAKTWNTAGAQGPLCAGVVETFNPQKGFGFIHNPDIRAQFGKDVFLHKDNALGQFKAGDHVVFVLEVREDGAPRGLEVRAAGKGAAAPSPGGKGKWKGQSWPALQAKGGASTQPTRYSGVVESFNEKKGFGFIHNPALLAQFGKDVFLHKDYANGQFKAGDHVTFMLEVREDGAPRGMDVRAKGTEKENSTPKGAKRPREALNGNTSDLKRYSGVVERFNPNKGGFGFVHNKALLAQFGKDVFLHKDNIAGEVTTGDMVSFVLEIREDGMPRALDVHLLKRAKLE